MAIEGANKLVGSPAFGCQEWYTAVAKNYLTFVVGSVLIKQQS